jgi:translation initiation factor IF-2
LLPGQWVQLADLAARLPPPAPPGQSGGTDDGATAVSDATPAETPAAADTPIVAAPANPGIDETPPVPPKPPAPAHPAPIRPAAKLVAHASPKKSPPVALADGEPPLHTNPLAHSAPLALATPQPARARVLSAMARPVRMMQPAVVTAVPSALGVRTAVPPAVPMGAE